MNWKTVVQAVLTRYQDTMHQSFVTTAPPPPGNSRDFDFRSIKSPLEALLCRNCWLVKPLLFSPRSLLSFHFTALFACIKQTSSIFPTPGKLWSEPHSFTRLSPTLPRGWGAVVTNDWCITKPPPPTQPPFFEWITSLIPRLHRAFSFQSF